MTSAIIITVLLFLLYREAFQEYHAEKHARQEIYHQNVSFVDFMVSHHPLLFCGGVILLIFVVLGIIMS